jgi:hypothetical protein
MIALSLIVARKWRIAYWIEASPKKIIGSNTRI